jgi:2-keto-4-pentenoate hydratase/2-oxohepta-3-ene-1,7-dioic acid hydratase in catechol pathway
MRFVSLSKNGVETVGVRLDTSVVDLSIAAPMFPSTLRGLIENDLLPAAADLASQASPTAHLPLASLRYLPVMPNPSLVINLIRHSEAPAPSTLGASISACSRLCAHLEPMRVPRNFGALDYGVELAVVLKRGGRHIAENDAVHCIAGYSVFNGGTVRGLPIGQTFAMARNSDHTAPFGPELVTPEELPHLAAGLCVTLKRNGVTVQSGMTTVFWNVADAIARTSKYMSLPAGAVITLGTLEGTVADAGGNYLRAGDILEAEIENIGVLLNPIVNET